jgi:O-antigen ligase
LNDPASETPVGAEAPQSAEVSPEPGPAGPPPEARPASRAGQLATIALIALPGLLTVYLSFDSGGFFAGAPGLVAALLGLLMVLRVTLADDPFAGLSRQAGVVLVALGLFAFWVLISFLWSDAPARSIVEFDRALMYWLAVLLFASVPWRRSQFDWAVRGLAAGILVVAAAALISRLLPEVLETARVDNTRLSYPLSYWNALGLLSALGSVLLVHLCASEREPGAVRVAAAAGLPIVAGTLFFTFSRGSIVAGVVGVLVYLALARPRGLPAALLSAGPATAATLIAAYRADLLAGDDPRTAAAVAQGHDVVVVVVVAVAAAAVLRLLLLGLDARLERMRPPSPSGGQIAGAAVALVAVVVVALTALGGAERIADQYDSIVSKPPSESGDLRSRLSSSGDNGRSDQWSVALGGFRDAPLTGQGAGTFPNLWAQERESQLKVEDAHSLYVETLSELGVVGFALLAGALLTLLVGLALRARRRASHAHAAILACTIGWALHAGIDWDWEMPAVTLWLFALGGMGLAAGAAQALRPSLGRLPRVAIGLGFLGLVILPALTATSQARLDDSVAAFKRGDCGTAIESALSSVDAMSVRPEPFVVIGYCDARLGKTELGIRALEAAVERDRDSWQLHYGLALMQASAGRDPRPEARAALRLNPREPLAREAVRIFRTDSPEQWQRRARRIPLPIL